VARRRSNMENGGQVPEMIGPGSILGQGLRVVFVGFNPSLPALRTGHHYANPTNRFFRLLRDHHLTERLLAPDEDVRLPDRYGIGLANLSNVASALVEASPCAVCFNGLGVFVLYFGHRPGAFGLQSGLAIGESAVFVVPSSSGAANGMAYERNRAWTELASWLSPCEMPRGVKEHD
jgi:double-stranded uracil-DNA glycosylase